MLVLSKEIIMMNYLFTVLYDTDNDVDFIKKLKDELEDETIKSIINSSGEKIKELFSEPFSVNEIKNSIKEANETYKKISEADNIELAKKLEAFDGSNFFSTIIL